MGGEVMPKYRCQAVIVQPIVEELNEAGEPIREVAVQPLKIYRPLWGTLTQSLDEAVAQWSAQPAPTPTPTGKKRKGRA